MVRLAVDDRRIAVARVLADVLPDVEHRAAGRVHERAAPPLQTLESLHRDAERGNDDDIRGLEAVERVAEVVEETHAGRPQPAVDVRVVNDLAGQEDAPVREPMPCLIGVVDRAVDAVAEAELARQTDRQTTGLRGVPRLPHRVDQAAVVVARNGAGNVLLQIQPLAIDGSRHGPSAVTRVRSPLRALAASGCRGRSARARADRAAPARPRP